MMYSASAPHLRRSCRPNTKSPGRRRLTSRPQSTTRPQKLRPGTKGVDGASRSTFRTIARSTLSIATAITLTITPDDDTLRGGVMCEPSTITPVLPSDALPTRVRDARRAILPLLPDADPFVLAASLLPATTSTVSIVGFRRKDVLTLRTRPMGVSGTEGLGGAGTGAGAGAGGTGGTTGAGATRLDSTGDWARPMCSARGGACRRGAGGTIMPGCIGEGIVDAASVL